MCLNLSPLNLQKAIQMLSVKLGIWRIFKLLIKYLTLQVNAKLSVLLFLWLYGDLYKYWSSISLLPVWSVPHCPNYPGPEEVQMCIPMSGCSLTTPLCCPFVLTDEMQIFTSQACEAQIRQEEEEEGPQSCSSFHTCGAALHGQGGGQCQQRHAGEPACSSWVLLELQSAMGQGETGNIRPLSAQNSFHLRKSWPCHHFAHESGKVKPSPL